MEAELPYLYDKLKDKEVILEAVLSSPLMTLFSNVLSFSEATHVLNMFILDGESFIVDVLMNVMKHMGPRILKMDDYGEIFEYMRKGMYD